MQLKVYILEQKVNAPPFPLDKVPEGKILITRIIYLGKCLDRLLLCLGQLNVIIG